MPSDLMYSTNEIWVGDNDELCLTDDLEDIKSDIATLETSKANANHTHSTYAAVDHAHTGYASASDVAALQNLVGDTAVLTQINNAVAGKVDAVDGKGLSSNDYTDAEKNKLAGIATGANAYVLPTAGSSLGGVKTTSTVTSNSGYTACPIINGVPYYKDTNTTYSSLKNPYALTLQFNGTTNKTYDGSSGQMFNVTPAAIGVADYVIAQGASGAWTYRKWNNGTYECWRQVTGTITNSGTWNNFKIFNGSADWPSGVFKANPTVFYNCYIGSGYAIACRGGLSTTTQFKWAALGTDGDSNVGFCIHVYAIGRWK
ncbi:MAG: hypothetical protein ACI4XN_12580 [Candidatus Kurthia intestinigallinarum]